MRPFRDLTSGLAAILLTAAASAAQTPAVAEPAQGTASFTIFSGSTAIGTEEVTLTRTRDGWQVSSTGRQRAPAALVINDFRLTLASDWHPRELRIDALLRDQSVSSTTTFAITTAVTDYVQGGQRASLTHQISPRTIVLPNAFYAPYEVMAARMMSASPGARFKVFVVAQAEVDAVVTSVSEEKILTTAGVVLLKRYELTVMNPGRDLPVTVDVDNHGRLARLVIPAAQLSVVRDDLSSVSSRPQNVRNPGDEDVFVPALGFNLAATVTKPANAPAKAPAVVLVGGSASTDRDETIDGTPVFGRLAGDLAAAGFMVLRYDKRGLGQSGGRPEAATLSEYADDARAAVTWLQRRKDVDKNRIAVVGLNEGAAVALIAARDKKIKAAVLIAGPGTAGYDYVLDQQRLALDSMKLEPADREARIAFQRRLMDAVMSGKGWEGIPLQVRATADTPWFRSLLMFDPAAAMKNVKQPLLVMTPERGAQVAPHHAERLAAIANQRKKAAPSAVVTVATAADAGAAIANFLRQALTLR